MMAKPPSCCAGTPMIEYGIVFPENNQRVSLTFADQAGVPLKQMYCPLCGGTRLVPRKPEPDRSARCSD